MGGTNNGADWKQVEQAELAELAVLGGTSRTEACQVEQAEPADSAEPTVGRWNKPGTNGGEPGPGPGGKKEPVDSAEAAHWLRRS